MTSDILYRCRRGMLELDLLLERRIALEYPQLTAEWQDRIARLLELEDDVLWRYLIVGETSPDPEIEQVCRWIRQV